MYICNDCGEASKPHEKRRLVYAMRPKTYHDKLGHYEGEGYEADYQIQLCTKCADSEGRRNVADDSNLTAPV